jgi:hypothetical protein
MEHGDPYCSAQCSRIARGTMPPDELERFEKNRKEQ